MSRLHLVFSNLRIAFVTLLAVGLVIVSVGHGDSVPDIKLIASSRQQDLVRWELTHFMDKWLARLSDLLWPGSPTDGQRLAVVQEFFQLGDNLRQAQGDLNAAFAAKSVNQDIVATDQAHIDALDQRRRQLQPEVEETMERAITQAATEANLFGGIGPLKWPPVDFTFEPGGLVLVRSPKDRIARETDLLLNPDISLVDQVAMEDKVEADEPNTSALIVRIGGVATYPAQVSPGGSLIETFNVAAHEWTHHWLFFKPLGKKWFAGGELQSINETVANIVGEEIGDRAYEILTGQQINRPPWTPPVIQPSEPVPSNVFDYAREMRQTRAQLETLLAAGKVEQANAYLEQRRLAFVAHGYDIRKLNTAWFAFYGTYADSAASISPIEGELRAIRADSASLSEFLQRVSVINHTGQLEQLALQAGWVPIDTTTGLPLSGAPAGSAGSP